MERGGETFGRGSDVERRKTNDIDKQPRLDMVAFYISEYMIFERSFADIGLGHHLSCRV